MKLIIDIPDEEYKKFKTPRCADLIDAFNDRSLFVRAIQEGKPYEEITNEDIQNAIKQGYNDGYEMAKAKFERPQGEWIHYLGCGIEKAVCSECGQLGETKKYCGNCGAKMKGGEE